MIPWRRVLDVSTTVALGIMAIVVTMTTLSRRPSAATVDRDAALKRNVLGKTIMLGREHQGAVGAPVGLVVFSDFECPFCGVFARNTLPQIQKKYVTSGKLIVTFRHFPNEAVH